MSVRVSRALPRLVVLLLTTMLLAPGHVARATALDATPSRPATPGTLPALNAWQPASGSFQLTDASRLVVPDPKLRNEAETFIADLSETKDRRLPMVARETKPRPGDIVLRLDPKRASLGAEGYELSVGTTIAVTARTATGAFWGTRTVLQLLRGGDAVPAGSAVDVPNYAERGVGVCACYIHVSMPWLERMIKDAAYLKLNQVWLEIKVKSKAHPEANQWGYYTPDEIARLQRLADKYHVSLVPEVNSPGHIDPWIANRTDLQLTDSSGAKQPSRLDVTKPEAFDFLTSIIDEYFKVFRTPYWHMGADEYMLGSDYAKYPQLAAYAKEKFGPDAVPEDAFIDFINRIDAYVKSKGKMLRIWNDGITPKATIPLNTDIVVEHWIGSDRKPSQLIAAGHPVQNASYSLYNVRGGFKSDTAGLYTQGWTPQSFEDEKVASPAGITGAKITLWPDNGSGNTENEIEDEVRMSMRFVAQSTWGEPNPDPTYAAFEARADAVGRAPGFANVDRTPVQPARYELAVGDSFLTGATTTEGAQAVLGGDATAFRLATTPDGYYTVKDPATGRCLESRQGARQLNVPLEPGAPLTLEACSASNRLQRWQLALQHGGVTLTNAITQMVAVLDGSGGMVQHVPDGHEAQVFQLVGTVDTTSAVARRTVGPGESTPVTVTVKNDTDAPISDVVAAVTAPEGWTIDLAERSRASVAAGETWTSTFTATWAGAQGHDTQGFTGSASYTGAAGRVTSQTAAAWDPPTTIPGDLAESGAATQISTANGGVAARAVDGNTNGSWGAGSLTHTAENITEPWWQVDLGQREWIGSVQLLNRTDCCSSRLDSPVILLSDTPLPDRLADALATPGVVSVPVSGAVGQSVTVPISGNKRYVRVQLPDTGTLSLAEVVVRAPQ